jgi:type I restriction enzyme M protein
MAKLSLAKLERHLYSAADRLRQEGLDAATYKDYIFGLLFLKRCSDVFEAERERIVGRRVERGMIKEVAETQYGENPDFYEGFFVPERARWDYLQSKLGDATEPYGSVLDKALGALSEANESLEHVLDHISFMRVQGNRRIISDDACKDLVRHFSRYRLRNEDFQFSDLLGAAYEFLAAQRGGGDIGPGQQYGIPLFHRHRRLQGVCYERGSERGPDGMNPLQEEYHRRYDEAAGVYA